MPEEGIFRVSLFGKYFLGFSLSGKVLFLVVQKYPTLLIPVCKNAKSTPWADWIILLAVYSNNILV